MAKKRYYHIDRTSRREVELDRGLDTSGTKQGGSRAGGGSTYEQTESVPPPFRGEDGSGYVKRSEVSLSWKVAGIVAAIFVTVGVPMIWFSSGLNKDVASLATQVGEIKVRTEKLFEGFIRNEERLNGVERSISVLADEIRREQNDRRQMAHDTGSNNNDHKTKR